MQVFKSVKGTKPYIESGVKFEKDADTTDFKNFTRAKTAVGGHNTGQYQLDGKLEGFSYYDTALQDEDIKGICKGGIGNPLTYDGWKWLQHKLQV